MWIHLGTIDITPNEIRRRTQKDVIAAAKGSDNHIYPSWKHSFMNPCY